LLRWKVVFMFLYLPPGPGGTAMSEGRICPDRNWPLSNWCRVGKLNCPGIKWGALSWGCTKCDWRCSVHDWAEMGEMSERGKPQNKPSKRSLKHSFKKVSVSHAQLAHFSTLAKEKHMLQGVTRGYKDGLQPETLADGNWLVKQNQPMSKIETKSDTNLRSLYESWFRNALISKSVILWLMTIQERNIFRARRSTCLSSWTSPHAHLSQMLEPPCHLQDFYMVCTQSEPTGIPQNLFV